MLIKEFNPSFIIGEENQDVLNFEFSQDGFKQASDKYQAYIVLSLLGDYELDHDEKAEYTMISFDKHGCYSPLGINVDAYHVSASGDYKNKSLDEISTIINEEDYKHVIELLADYDSLNEAINIFYKFDNAEK